jgi:hypothetical protein
MSLNGEQKIYVDTHETILVEKHILRPDISVDEFLLFQVEAWVNELSS